jgi:hypothetical protein
MIVLSISIQLDGELFFLQLISPPSIQINQMPANVQAISIMINKLSKIIS